MRTSFFVGTFLLGIAGCAGGGGGGGSGSSAVVNPAPSIVTFTSFSSVQPNSKVRMSGRAVTGDYQFDLNQNQITAVSFDGFGGLTADVTVGDQFGTGNITSGSIDPANGATVSFSCATDTCVDADPFASAIGVNSSDGTKILFVAAPADSRFEYQTFGGWVTGYNTGAGEFGAMSVGAKTSASTAQGASGTASYTGFSYGFAAGIGEGYLATRSFVYADLTFGSSPTMALTSGSTAGYTDADFIRGSQINLPEFDFTGLLSFNSSLNRFEGTISSTLFPADFNGNAEGALFGPGAEEFGGLFEMSTPGGELKYGGAFGGRRD